MYSFSFIIFLDILFCINTNGKPVPIPERIKNRTVLSDFKKPPELGKWFAITALVRNSVLYYTNEYNGLTLCKIRQLKKLGYEPILVRFVYTKLFSIMVQIILIDICTSKILLCIFSLTKSFINKYNIEIKIQIFSVYFNFCFKKLLYF